MQAKLEGLERICSSGCGCSTANGAGSLPMPLHEPASEGTTAATPTVVPTLWSPPPSAASTEPADSIRAAADSFRAADAAPKQEANDFRPVSPTQQQSSPPVPHQFSGLHLPPIPLPQPCSRGGTMPLVSPRSSPRCPAQLRCPPERAGGRLWSGTEPAQSLGQQHLRNQQHHHQQQQQQWHEHKQHKQASQSQQDLQRCRPNYRCPQQKQQQHELGCILEVMQSVRLPDIDTVLTSPLAVDGDQSPANTECFLTPATSQQPLLQRQQALPPPHPLLPSPRFQLQSSLSVPLSVASPGCVMAQPLQSLPAPSVSGSGQPPELPLVHLVQKQFGSRPGAAAPRGVPPPPPPRIVLSVASAPLRAAAPARAEFNAHLEVSRPQRCSVMCRCVLLTHSAYRPCCKHCEMTCPEQSVLQEHHGNLMASQRS